NLEARGNSADVRRILRAALRPHTRKGPGRGHASASYRNQQSAALFDHLLGERECGISIRRMSALGQKRTSAGRLGYVRFTPESGHEPARLGMSALCQ